MENMNQIVRQYEERVQSWPSVARLNNGRPLLTKDGAPSKSFFFYLFTDNSMAIEFLKDIGMIQRKMQCNPCHQDMTWTAR
jgi:hypothetical protein